MAKKLSKTEQAKLDAQIEYQNMRAEAQSVIDALRASPDWQNSTVEHKEEVLDYYVNNTFAPYAEQRFGSDIVSANMLKNAILNPLRDDIKKQREETYTWYNRLDSVGNAIATGAENAYDMGAALYYGVDAIQDTAYREQEESLNSIIQNMPFLKSQFESEDAYNQALAEVTARRDKVIADRAANNPEFIASMNALRDEIARTEENKKRRQAENKITQADEWRRAEIKRRDSDAWYDVRRIAEDPAYLVNLLSEQAVNLVPSLAGGVAGGVVGRAASALGRLGSTGTSILTKGGSVVGSSTAAMAQGAGEVASGVAQEVFQARPEQIGALPEYQMLINNGYSDEEARAQIAAKAITEITPAAAGLTAITNLFGPEMMLLRTGILQSLVKGGIARRVLTAGVLGAPGEFAEESGQQVLQNVGWNKATGDTRDPSQGAIEAGVTGAIVGGVFGGLSGIRRRNTQTATDDTSSTEGGVTPSTETTPQPEQAASPTETTPQPEQAASPTETVPQTDQASEGGASTVEETAPTQPQRGTMLGGINIPDQTRIEAPVGNQTNPKYNETTASDQDIVTDRVSDATTRLFELDNSDLITEEDLVPIIEDVVDMAAYNGDPDIIERVLANVQMLLNSKPHTTTKSANELYDEAVERRVNDIVDNQQPTTTIETEAQTEQAVDEYTDVIQDLNRQLQEQISGEAATTGESNSDGSGTATTQQDNSGTVVSPDTPIDSGVNETTESAGVSGTTRSQPGTVAGNVQTDQSMGGPSGSRTDGRRSDNVDGTAAAQSDPRERGDVTETEQRTSDAERTTESGGTTESRIIIPTREEFKNELRALINQILQAGDAVTQANIVANFFKLYGYEPTNDVIVDEKGKPLSPDLMSSITALESIQSGNISDKTIHRSLKNIHPKVTLAEIKRYRKLDEDKKLKLRKRNYVDYIPDIDDITASIYYDYLTYYTEDPTNETAIDFLYNRLGRVDYDTKLPLVPQLNPDATIEETASYIQNELEIAGRSREQAIRETIILLAMYKALGSVTRETPAQMLQNLRFRIGSNTNTIVNRFYQEMYHVSSKVFNNFSTQYVGSGHGALKHGWGVYFSKLKDAIVNKYGRGLKKNITDENHLYKVSIPDNDFLLDEQAILANQSNYIIECINNLKLYFENELLNAKSELDVANIKQIITILDNKSGTGWNLYYRLVFYFFDQLKFTNAPNIAAKEAKKSASLLLKNFGISGISYHDNVDGECAVIFDDAAIQILETLYQNDRGRIVFYSDGTVEIVFEQTADDSTAVHEFAHLMVMNMLAVANDTNVPASTSKAQLVSDLQTLASYAGIAPERALDVTAWVAKPHEKVAKAFEAYLRTGKAPEGSGLDALFKKFKEVLTALYAHAKMLIGKKIPKEVTAVFDRMLTGYDVQSLAEQASTPISQQETQAVPETQAVVIRESNNMDFTIEQLNGTQETRTIDINNTTIEEALDTLNANRPISVFIERADGTTFELSIDSNASVEQILQAINITQQALDLSIDEAAMNSAADLVVEAEQNPNSLVVQAALQAAQDPLDLTSVLPIVQAMDERDIVRLAAGQFPVSIKKAITDIKSPFLDSDSTVVRGPSTEGVSEEELEPDMEQLITEYQSEVEAAGMPETGVEVQNSDGTQTVESGKPSLILSLYQKPIASIAQTLIQMENAVSLQRGRDFIMRTLDSFAKVNYGPVWVAGRWAKMCTAIRKSWMDGGAHFYRYCLEWFSAASGDPSQTPLWRSFSTLSNRIFGAARIFVENALNPINDWANKVASEYDIDAQVLLRDVGLYRTCLHTIEAAYKQAIELQQALQRAMLLPAGEARDTAMKAAQKALDAFNARQQGQVTNVPVYGGRSVQEAYDELTRLRDEYDSLTNGQGKALLDAGNAELHTGLRWVTRWLMENGQLSEEDVARFDDWLYYCPLTTEQYAEEGAVNNIFYFSPRQNFHRYGSRSAAEDAYTALVKYGSRASRTVGMSEFSYTLKAAYDTLKGQGINTGKFSVWKTYGNIALIPANYINGVLYGNNPSNRQGYDFAKTIERNASTVIRLVENKKEGGTVTKAYYVLFTKQNEEGKAIIDSEISDAVRSPFRSADPDVVFEKLAKATSTYAWIYTRARLYFPILTSVRDMIERLSLLPAHTFTNDKGKGVSGIVIAAKMLGFSMNPVNFYRLARFWFSGKSGSTRIDNHLHDFFNSGTDLSGNYNKMLSNLRQQTATDIRAALPNSVQKLGSKTVGKALNVLNKWGEFFYSLPAFCQFIKMRESGIDLQQTVYAVTRLMNMQQRGKFAGRYLAPLFPFVNSIGQTAGNMLYALGLHTAMFGNHPNAKYFWKSAAKGWAVMFLTYAATRTLVPLVASALGDDDEEKGLRTLDMMPLANLAAATPIGVGDGNYVKWPHGFGLPMFGAMFGYGLDRVERGKMSMGDFAATLITTFAKTLVPNSMPAFAFSEDPIAFIMQTMSPMLAQPVVQAATNRSYSGSRLTYDSFDRTIRKSDSGQIPTNQIWKDAAQVIYETTGGTIDLSPEQIRAIANGYFGGVLQGLVAWAEADPLYKHPMYESTREQIGPVWTALGATSIYGAVINVDQTAFYNAREYYEGKIKRTGIGKIIKGTAEEKRRIMMAAGFPESEINDFLIIQQADKALADINTDLRKRLDKLMGPDMEEDVVRTEYTNWGLRRQQVLMETNKRLYFYQPEFRMSAAGYDRDTTTRLRNGNPSVAVEAGNIDLSSRPLIRDENGTAQQVEAMMFQDVDGLQVVIPTSGPNGEAWTDEEALQYYFTTGQHLGKYRTVRAAEQAVRQLNKNL